MILRRFILFHLLAWALLIGAVMTLVLLERNGDPVKTLIHFAGLICVFYFVYCFVCPFTLRRSRLLVFIPLLLLGAPLVYLGVAAVFSLTADFTSQSKNTFTVMGAGIVAVMVYSLEEAFRRQKESRQLKAQMAEAELSFLRAQVNPHFLYNTLNYFFHLARPASAELADAVVRLSDLMRFTLAETADGHIKLMEEIAHIRNYIHLIRLRFQPHFFVTLEVEGEPGNVQVPALLFIPFVENAIKHGVVNDPEHPVAILFRITEKTVFFQCRNQVNRDQKPPSTGVGLRNVRRRLELLFPSRHRLTIPDDPGTFSVELDIHLKNTPI